MESGSTGDEALIELYHNLTVLQFNQYQETHELETLQTAVRTARMSAQLIPLLRNHPRRSEILRTYHNVLLDHFRLTINPVDMVEALLILNQALDFLPENDPYAKEAVNFMVKIYSISPVQIWKLKELESDDSRERDLTRSRILYVVSDLYFKGFEQLQRMDLLHMGCQFLSMALDHAPRDTEGLLHWFGKLAFMLQRGYDQNGDMTLLTESIEVCVAIKLSLDAVAAATKPTSKVVYLNNLGNRLEDRFDRMHRVEDLREAIEVTRSALQYATDPDPYPLCNTKHNIGVKLHKLHPGPLEESLTLLKEAVHSMPSIDDVPATWLNSISVEYRRHYLRHKDLEALETAIRYQTQAVKKLSRQHLNWPSYSDNMAWLLRE
ncbi:TPR domain containing protein [Fusarium oxysporum f. sp. phaseoli]